MIRPILAVVFLLAGSRADSFAQSSFTGLGFLPGCTHSKVEAISADGKVVVGVSWSTLGTQAFRWTAAGGIVGLGFMPGCSNSWAYAISADGSVIVGTTTAPSFRPKPNHVRTETFRWTAVDGMVSLGSSAGKHLELSPRAVSSDGSVVVGRADGKACRWTTAGGIVDLGNFSGGSMSEGLGVSADGKVVVGTGEWRQPIRVLGPPNEGKVVGGGSVCRAFRWTAESGMVDLGCLQGERGDSSARAVSSDGSVVVGCSSSPSGSQPFRWTATGGMIGLGHLRGGTSSDVKGVSGDGSVVVGQNQSFSGEEYVAGKRPSLWVDEAIVWDSVHGMRSLQIVLTNEYNLNLTGWKLTDARGISADGKTIVGTGKHNGHYEPWLAHLDKPLNAPATKGKSQQAPSSR